MESLRNWGMESFTIVAPGFKAAFHNGKRLFDIQKSQNIFINNSFFLPKRLSSNQNTCVVKSYETYSLYRRYYNNPLHFMSLPSFKYEKYQISTQN